MRVVRRWCFTVLLFAALCGQARADGGWDYQHGPIGPPSNVALGSGYGVALGLYQAWCSSAGYHSCGMPVEQVGECGSDASQTCTGTQTGSNGTDGSGNVSSGTANGYIYSHACKTGYAFNGSYSAPACTAVCLDGSTPVDGQCPTCFQPSGTPDPMIAAAGDAEGQQSCMQGCQVQYVAGTTITSSDNTSGSFGYWKVLGAPGQNGNGCTAPVDTHQSAATTDGKQCHGALCLDEPNNGLCQSGECAPLNNLSGGGCTSLPSGGSFCISSAPTPPAPDDGTPGQKATPDGTMDGTGAACPSGMTTCSISSFSSSTNSNSTTHGGGGSSGGTGTSSSGGGTIGGSGSSGSSGGGSGGGCSSSSSGGSLSGGCSGTGTGNCDPTKTQCGNGSAAPFAGPGGDSKTFQQTMEDLQATVSGAPVYSAMSGFADGMPTGGTVPSSTVAVPFLNQSYTFGIDPALVDPIRSPLQLIMQFVWLLIATFIFFDRK